MSTKPTSLPTVSPTSPRRTPPASRRATPPPATRNVATAPVAQEPATPLPADQQALTTASPASPQVQQTMPATSGTSSSKAPAGDLPWAGVLLLALMAVEKAKERCKHAEDRVPVTQAAVAEAKAALARAEASGPLQYSGTAIDGEAVARQRLDDAEMDAARAQRIAAALAETVEERRAALRPLVEPGREGLLLWVERELALLDQEYALVIQNAAGIIARAVAIGDASGAAHLVEPLLRARLPGSLLHADIAMQIGTLQGMTEPEQTETSARARRLRGLLEAARAAAEPTIMATDRRAA